MNILLIIASALLPVFVLIVYTYKWDKLQPEPLKMILRGLLFGMISAFLSLAISYPLEYLGFYQDKYTTVLGAMSNALFGAAIPEEIAKLFMLWLLLRKNKYYDEFFDGIVYAACIGLGFAGMENVLYLLGNQSQVILLATARAFLSVPGHFCYAVTMGYFYSLVHFTDVHRKKYMLLLILLPILFHFIFDSILFVNITCSLLLVAVLVYMMWKISNKRMKFLLHLDEQVIASEKIDEILNSPTEQTVKCSQCGASLTNRNSNICPNCGAPIVHEEKRYCRFCGYEVNIDSVYCPHCGAELSAERNN